VKRLIREEEVREAAKGQKKIFIDAETVITPAARDAAAQLGVVFDDGSSAYAPSPALTRVVQSTTVHKVAIASDHGGFYLKEELKTFLREKEFMVIDLGPMNANSCDYPDYAFKVAQMVSGAEADRGIIIDSVGIGSAMAANKVPGVLAAKCNNATEAASAREHNYANVLTLGAKIIGSTMARDIVLAFLKTKGGEERHQRRVAKILDYETKKDKK